MCKLLEKKVKFQFFDKSVKSFKSLKRKLIEVPILISPNWEQLFKLMYDASDVVVGAMFCKQKKKDLSFHLLCKKNS